MRFIIIVLLFLSGCSSEISAPKAYPWQTINGRDAGNPTQRFPTYRAQIPSNWLRQDPNTNESIADTTKPLVTFIIPNDNDEKIRITIHNFPISNIRIPPISQIKRWERQFTSLDSISSILRPMAQGGFSGLYFFGQGLIAGNSTSMCGWAMQLAPEHNSNLSTYIQLSRDPSEIWRFQQMLADYTIKAVGPPDLMSQYSEAIHAFARSFELIQEIPNS